MVLPPLVPAARTSASPAFVPLSVSVPVASTSMEGVTSILAPASSLEIATSLVATTPVGGQGPDLLSLSLGESFLHADFNVLGKKRSREEGSLLFGVSLSVAEAASAPPSALALWKSSLQRRLEAGVLQEGLLRHLRSLCYLRRRPFIL